MAGELRKILDKINLEDYKTRYEVFGRVINMWEGINPSTVRSADLSSCDALLKEFNFDQSSKSYYDAFLNPTMLFIKLLLNIIHGSKQASFASSTYKSMLEDLGTQYTRVSVYCQNAVAELNKFVAKKITATTLENSFRKTISDIRKTVLESLKTMYETHARLSLKAFVAPRTMAMLQDFATRVNKPGSDLRSSVFDQSKELEVSQIKANTEAVAKLDIIVKLMSIIFRPTDARLTNLEKAVEKCKNE